MAVIASQDFNAVGGSTANTDRFAADAVGVSLTNTAASNADPALGLVFGTQWTATRNLSGPNTSPSDTDFIGVNSFSGSNAPNVAADGTAVASGVEQNFEFNDGDGRLDLVFAPVDASGFENRELTLNYWIRDTGFEATDSFRVTVSDGTSEEVVLDLGEPGLEASASADDGTANWQTLSVDLDALIAGGLDPGSLVLTISADTNSSLENIFVDNIVFAGDPVGSTTPGITLAGADDLQVSEDGDTDSFIVTLDTTPAAAVDVTLTADAQTQLSVNGVTFADSLIVTLADTDPATVTVRAVDDAAGETRPHPGTIAVAVASTDPDYNGLGVPDLSVAVDDNDVVKIHDIQGDGAASALEGEVVKIEAVVVGDFQGSSGLRGFFVQEQDADVDADANTSEGLFISEFSVDVMVGDLVEIMGEVDEFGGLTQLIDVSEITVVATDVTLPTASAVTLPIGQDLEAVEGMLVTAASTDAPLTVIENFNLDRFGQITVSNGNQIQPTQLFDAQTEAADVAALDAQNAANRLIVDDGSTQGNPDTYTLIDSGDGTPLTAGDPITADGPTLRLGAEIEPGTLEGPDPRLTAVRLVLQR